MSWDVDWILGKLKGKGFFGKKLKNVKCFIDYIEQY